MKRRIIPFLALFIFSAVTNVSFSQFGQTEANITGLGPAAAVSFTSPYTGSTQNTQGALMVATIDGEAALLYCVDILRTISFPDVCHRDSAVTNPYILYILQNYYPFNPDPVGKLDDLNNEVASTQLAIWSFSDGVDLTTVTNSTLQARAIEIRTDALNNGGSTSISIFNTILILPGTGPNDFYIRTVDQNNAPVAINDIKLSIDQGSLSVPSVNTDASGNSPEVQVIGTGTGTITASASSTYPGGITYTCSGKQRLVIAKPVVVEVTKQADWGALPVELSSLSATVANRNATLNWSTVTESNNSGFNIERKSVGSNDWKNVGNVAGNGTTNNPHDYSFTDKNLESGKYQYRLKQIDFNGNFEYHNLVSEVEIGNPSKFDLSQNYPNPFNPSTKINYDLPLDGFASIKVYDINGKEVATLVSENVTAGFHTVTFDASSLPSGVYYYKLQSNGFSKVMKMALIK